MNTTENKSANRNTYYESNKERIKEYAWNRYIKKDGKKRLNSIMKITKFTKEKSKK